MLRKQLPSDIEAQVREWVESFEGYKVDKHSGASVIWGFRLVSQDKTAIELSQAMDRTDHIVISQKTELVSTLKNLLGQLSEPSKAQLFFELMTETYRSDCQITIMFIDRTPQAFAIAMPLFADGLTQDNIFYRINKVNNTRKLLLAILNRAALNYPKNPPRVTS